MAFCLQEEAVEAAEDAAQVAHAADSQPPSKTGSRNVMVEPLRQLAPPERTGAGWRVFDHLVVLSNDDRSALERMTSEQQQVLAFNLLRTEVNHGGFDFFFRYRGNFAPVAREVAFASPAWAELIGEACDALGIPYPSDEEGFCEALERLDDQDPDLLARLDQRLYQLEVDEPPDQVIDGFIWSHKPEFFI